MKKTVNNGKTPPKPWCGIGDEFGDFLDGDTVLFTEFMWEDVGYTWKNYFGKARIAMEKKSFGWWFSYPTLKGTVNTAYRYAFGAVGVTAVATSDIALRARAKIILSR